MTEALTLAVYFLLCRELGQPPNFPGNEYIWNGVDDKSYAPSIADLAVFASTHDHCADQAFNHANGDVFIWKNFWPKLAAYWGMEVSCFSTLNKKYDIPFCLLFYFSYINS